MWQIPKLELNKPQTFFSWSKFILIPCLHVTALFFVYRLLLMCGVITAIDPYFFYQWDAPWYGSIAEHGYLFSDVKPSNSGFFPLFAYEWKVLWKLTGAGVEGVCIFNIIVFLAGLLVLKKTFDFSWAFFLAVASIPSNMFMYVPYTEATFFFFSAIILAGLKTKRFYMVLTGLFFASITRPTATFFIPAIIAMEFLHYENSKLFLKHVLVYCAAPLVGILGVVLFQYKATGVWFAYFKTQAKFCSHALQWPEFPLSTWGGPPALWLDGFALFSGLLAGFVLLIFLIAKLKKHKESIGENYVVFSLVYLFVALLSSLFFNGKDADGGTSLLSTNRYMLATPFFIMVLLQISRTEFRFRHWLSYGLIAFCTVLLLNVNSGGFFKFYAADKVFYLFVLFLNILMYTLFSKKFDGRFLAMIYLVNITAQVVLLYQFARTVWIG